MLVKSLRLTLAGLSESAVQRVVVIGLLSATVIFVGALVGLMFLLPLIPEPGWAWLGPFVDVLAGLAVVALILAAAYVLFPGLATLVMSFFLEEVVYAVEIRHYPDAARDSEAKMLDEIALGLRFFGLTVGINLLILPIYLILVATGVGSLAMAALFLVVNGMLMGREFFEMVAVRHARRQQVAMWRRHWHTPIFRGGLVIAALFMIPFVNLLAPVLGAMFMTHLFHHLHGRRAL